ncbi:hypothetical protein JHK86_017767 [Glycine max]|nr:hypothetical protein JHK86_017767 [Glycine max]
MEGWFASLNSLKVYSCQSVKVIFEIKDSQQADASGGIDTNLQVVDLCLLPKLEQVWSRDPGGILNFKKLQSIKVFYCERLRNVFPASVAKDVPKLEYMLVGSCDGIVEIVACEDGSETNTEQLVFPELTFMFLYNLSSIQHFYRGRHPIECPKLKKLSVGKCNEKLKTFRTGERSNEEDEAMLSAEKIFPNLEYLDIDFDEAQKWLLSNTVKHRMHRLKELWLSEVNDGERLCQILYRLPNLEKLFLRSAKHLLKESSESRLGTVLQLKELDLVWSEIKDIGFEREPVLQRLELLSLNGCDKLRNLGPPSVSLAYLTNLKVEDCNGLRNLMASSTAKSLVQLKSMKISGCYQLEEIVTNEGNEEAEQIVFGKLITIELVRLKKLKSFCSYKKCEFKFPSLEVLIVRKCPWMERFTEGGARAPKLENIVTANEEGKEEAKWQWEGDLNATIQKGFNKLLESASTVSSLSLLGDSPLQVIWLDSRRIPKSCFSNLKSLTVDGCQFLTDVVIPFYLLPFLTNLEQLEVRNCGFVKSIFEVKTDMGLGAAAFPRPLPFSLKELTLERLPKLENIWNEDPHGILTMQLLQHVIVAEDNADPREANLELTFPCPCVRSLKLQGLPKFKYFYYCSLQTPTEDEMLLESASTESSLSLRDSPLQVLWIDSGRIPKSCFSNLKSLTVDGCQFLTDVVIPFYLLPFLTNLEQLEVSDCGSVKSIFDITQEREITTMGLGAAAFPRPLPFSLKELTLERLPKLENVWNEDPHGILSVQHLQVVIVKKCKCLTSVFPASVAKDLEKLVVEDCKGLIEIVAEDNADPREANLELTFPCPCVSSLKLQGLPKFKYFYYCSLQTPTEDEMPTSNLKCLSLGEKGLEMIKRGEFQRNFLLKLQVLTLCFHNGSDVFPYEILQLAPNIEKLVVYNASFKEINVDYTGLLLQLKDLCLESLPELVSIGLENSSIQPLLGNLETLEVIGCSSLKDLVPSTVSFSNLTYLKVERWNCLLYLFTSSTAKSLTRLKRMEIKRCDSIEEVVSKEGGESHEDEIIFPQLNCLKLEGLRKLRSFYKGSLLSFPSLEELSVIRCEWMETLCPGTLKADKLVQVQLEPTWRHLDPIQQHLIQQHLISLDGVPIKLENDLNSTMREAFREKLLESASTESSLSLRDSPLQVLWIDSGRIPKSCFSNLKSLTVDGCQFLTDVVIPFYLLPFLTNLEQLEVSDCGSVKSIFDITQEREMTTMGLGAAAFPRPLPFSLKELTLERLPKLENVWNEDPHGILSVQHLQVVIVKKCKCLTSVFPASVAKDLEKLVVEDCKGLIEIVAEDNADPREANLELTFPCPCVRSLKLHGLPKFKYFYYSSLQCDMFQTPPTEDEMPTSNLPCLSLGEKGLEMIKRGEFQRNFLHKLQVLTLCFRIGSNVFPNEILQLAPNIEKLVVCDGSFKEIFCFDSLNVDEAGLILQLKVLCLESLPELVSIGLENSWIQPLLGNLETLEVIGCSSLKDLVPSTVSFSSLTYLEVERCPCLLYLFTSSTARSLTRLKRMEIKWCGSIEEVVSKEGGESHEDEIIFPQLNCLKLEGLPKLRSFYKGSLLSFPSLEELSVINCEWMETLCPGTLKADKLVQLQLDRDLYEREESSDAIKLENDLNSIMREAFWEKLWDYSHIDLKDSPVQEIWLRLHSLHIPPHFCFSDLDTLIVDGCHFLSDAVLPFSLLPLLPKLKTLKVRNCDFVKIIFDVTTMVPLPFALEDLILERLPNLENVWNSNVELTFPQVKSLALCDLPKLKYDMLKPFTNLEPHALNQLCIQKLTPNIEHLTLGQHELNMILSGEFQGNHLNELKVLALFFHIESDVFVQRVPNIEKLEVLGGFFREIFCFDSLNVDEAGLLSQLKVICSDSLPELVSIGSENSGIVPFLRNLETLQVISCLSSINLVPCTVSFSNLTYLKVKSCKSLLYLFTSSTARTLGQLKTMEISWCDSIEEIVSSTEEGDESDENEIIFQQLNCLVLKELGKLRRFYKGSLSFPSLEEFTVRDCERMESLCAGTVKTDKLLEVTFEWRDDIPLETDLNSAMQNRWLYF